MPVATSDEITRSTEASLSDADTIMKSDLYCRKSSCFPSGESAGCDCDSDEIPLVTASLVPDRKPACTRCPPKDQMPLRPSANQDQPPNAFWGTPRNTRSGAVCPPG